MESEVLLRYLRGESHLNERIAVYNWAKASEENACQLKAMRIVYGSLLMSDKTVSKRLGKSRKAWIGFILSVIAACVAAVLVVTHRATDVEEPVPFVHEYLYTAPFSGATKVMLPDGSKVTMCPEARLVYSEMTDGLRQAKLSGEAFFEVAKDAEHPFVVDAEGVAVKVLGTSFNLDAKDEKVVVMLESGIVEIGNGSASARIAPGQKYSFDRSSGEFSVSAMVLDDYHSKKPQYLAFENTPLTSVFEELGRLFKINVICSIPPSRNKCLTGKLDLNEGFEQSVRTISFIVPLTGKYDENGNYKITLEK